MEIQEVAKARSTRTTMTTGTTAVKEIDASCSVNSNTPSNYLALHELIELYDWEGVLNILKVTNNDNYTTISMNLAAQWKEIEQEDEDGFLSTLLLLPLHCRELYEPGIWYQVIERIVEAYPQALGEPILAKIASVHANNKQNDGCNTSSSSDHSHSNDKEIHNQYICTRKYPLHVALETMLETQARLEHERQQEGSKKNNNNNKYDLLLDEGYHKHCQSVIQLFVKHAPHTLQIPNDEGTLPLHLASQLYINEPSLIDSVAQDR